MSSIKRLKWLVAPVVLLAATGCAKTQVKTTQEIANTGMKKPEKVLIYNFDYSPSAIKLNSSALAKMKRSGDDQNADRMQVGREVADALATELTTDLAALGMNTLRADENMPVTAGAVLIVGHFSNIDEGNPLRRDVVGLGMGQSSLDAQVQLLAPGRSGYEKLITFDAHADSGSMPGAAVLGPAGVAAGAGTAAVVAANAATGAVKTYKSASAHQAKKIADQIKDKLAAYFAEQGWISPDLAR